MTLQASKVSTSAERRGAVWAFIDELAGWMPGLLCLWFILWPLSHVSFWREYRRLYPERPAPRGPGTFLFRHSTGTREWRILTTRQAVPSLEWRRRLFHAIRWLMVLPIGLMLLSGLRADPRLGPRLTTPTVLPAAPTAGDCSPLSHAPAIPPVREIPQPAVPSLPRTPEC